jgi:gentisate 1,2-dioxygenase
MSQPSDRKAFYDRIGQQNLTPLWEVLHGLVTPEPVHRVQPTIWRYADIRDHIMASGELITAKEAERRVLILENPGLPGESKITTSLYAGLQLILPGEVAPAHRHTQSALRFVVEGEGAYTAVDGERTTMHPGDFVITPSWTWHDHGNDSDEPMVWLDGLDIPMVSFFGASFAEKWPEDSQPLSRPEGDSLARYGQGLMPEGYKAHTHTSPVFNYPYDRTREALETMRREQEWDPAQGLKLNYVNPVNGDFAMPTIGTFMQLLPKGFDGIPYRATDATVFSVVEGTGSIHIGDETFTFGPRDHFVAPSWMPYRFSATEDCVIFSFSDRPVQQKLDLWREQRGNR